MITTVLMFGRLKGASYLLYVDAVRQCGEHFDSGQAYFLCIFGIFVRGCSVMFDVNDEGVFVRLTHISINGLLGSTFKVDLTCLTSKC